MTLAVVYRSAARLEFYEAAIWYENQRPGLGAAFVAEVNHAIAIASAEPERFRSCTAKCGVFACTGFRVQSFFGLRVLAW